MPHRDESTLPTRRLDELRAAIVWLLEGCDFSAICWKHQCTWTPRLLASVALLWACSDESTLGERFKNSRRIGLAINAVVGDVAGSYQAFLKLLNRWSERLLAAIQVTFRSRMQVECAEHWHIAGRVVMCIDGTHIRLPRTQALEAQYAPTRKPGTRRRHRTTTRASQRKANLPQLLLTTIWHAGTGLVWDWRFGPSDDSERRHLSEMLAGLPGDVLLTADAGFVGYDVLRTILDSGRDVLIRVGGNVRLLTQLGYAREYQQTVWLWPDKQARQHQEPLMLRMAVFHEGKGMMHVLTNVPKRDVSDAGLLQLYRRRWGIEVYYRDLKETFGRDKLRSRTAAAVETELAWSLAGMWAISLYATAQLIGAGHSPHRRSCAAVLRIFRRWIRDWQHPCEPTDRLVERLSTAVTDGYARKSKKSRGTPRKRTKPPTGIPLIIPATAQQKQRAQRIKQQQIH